ncbi:DUF1073 domain-containing protein [Acetobacter sp. TBRC 12305]|uniref:DUF1073 domain-containing protein n=1 Tax=Acetobacter garciniae TaxID=2817435 RepID=A0A939HN82_9PROT|nr:DUF1073 domain-containing protein [Acetobacter garciniae]MBO1325356.1 DUF1073 domain-containing protein [Acetobacter garciniae]MBX0345472.1 DUF1073 domain-containing protein [Acetobacter garciniae]
MKLFDWFTRKAGPVPAAARVEPVVKAKERRKMPRFVTVAPDELQSRAEALFKPYQPPAGVRGDGKPGLAMDTGLSSYMGSNYNIVSNFLADGLNFKGYADLAAMMLRAEFRKPVETIVKESTREWIKFRSVDTKAEDDGDVSDRLREIEGEFRRLRVRDVVRRQITHGMGYGLGHIWIGIKGAALNTEGQEKPLVIGPNGVQKGSVEQLINIDPIWTNPNAYNADNPLKPDYYRPQNWWVQGTLVHTSRLLTVVPFEVPDILKPAFNFGGLALPQMLEAYVHNFLRTRQSVSDLVSNFATKVLKTDMAGNAQTDGCMDFGDIDADSVTGRVAAMNAWQSNNGTFVIDKENEDFAINAVPLGTLDALQAQSMEFMAGIPGIPLVKLFGIQPTGLNASSDGEIRVFYDEIAAFQEAHMGPTIRAIFHLVQLNLWGEIDPDLDFEFVHLWQLSEKEAAEVEKIKADTDAVNVQAGILAAEEARERQAGDPQSIYRNVNLSGAPPDPPDPERDGAGLEGLLKRGEESEDG